MCSSVYQKLNAVSSKADLLRTSDEFFQGKMYRLFTSCNLLLQDEISRFVRHCIRIKKYFHGEMCKVDYMSGSFPMYDENVSEL